MKLRLQMVPALDTLAQLSDTLEAALLGHGVTREHAGRARLIVEELACNTLEHSHLAAGQPPLEVGLQVERGALVLEFRDSGPAFDLRTAPAPDLDADIAERPIGGLGLHLVRQLADHIDYRHDAGLNVVRVTLLQPFDPIPQELPT
ncbi:ATP-binding protein [Xanthomonas theicola]|uniref:Anti-sigma F factor n=1 Tax=Xanthomonas theicola TaxID=56464 RepID=A0A2S6ZIW5_9XANT|nr:ATP-binding protein [Xanthomonas theicola]PPT92223.1 anti-sigma F factor [Xanthomonas theicola]QNH25847.1 ATP-binding protein [Xanthomonas theicola]